MVFSEEQFLLTINKWKGIPYLHAGKTKSAGVDCINFILCVYEDLEVFVPGEIKYLPYSPDWHMHQTEERILNMAKQHCFEISKIALRYGDLILMKFGKCFSHGALYIKEYEIIHSILKRGVVKSNICHKYWNNREHKYFRLKGF